MLTMELKFEIACSHLELGFVCAAVWVVCIVRYQAYKYFVKVEELARPNQRT